MEKNEFEKEIEGLMAQVEKLESDKKHLEKQLTRAEAETESVIRGIKIWDKFKNFQFGQQANIVATKSDKAPAIDGIRLWPGSPLGGL